MCIWFSLVVYLVFLGWLAALERRDLSVWLQAESRSSGDAEGREEERV